MKTHILYHAKFCKEFFLKYSLFVILIFSGFIVAEAQSETVQKDKPQDCSQVISNLVSKNTNLSLALTSINSLLMSKPDVEVPLSTMFQVDLKAPGSVLARIAELSNLGTEDKILNLSEFKIFSLCAKSHREKNLLADTIGKQIELNNKRLEFLELSKEARDILISAYMALRQQSADKQQIDVQLNISKTSLGQAQTNLLESENESAKIASPVLEKILSSRALLEKFVIDIETEHIAYINKVKEERASLDELRNKLSRHTGVTNSLHANDLNSEFVAVDTIWRAAADKLLDVFTKVEVTSEYAFPANLEIAIPSDEAEKIAYEEYENVLQKTRQRLNELTEQKSQFLINLKALNFRLLNDAGKLRAHLISYCDDLGVCNDLVGINDKYASGIVMELRILPLKFLAGALNKIVEFNTKLGSGIEGWTNIARQVLVFLFLVILPFVAHKLFSWVSVRLNLLRVKILSRSIIGYRRRTLIAMWITRLNPFVPSIGMIISIHIARLMVETTDLAELSLFLFYLQIFFVYRVSKTLLKIFMEALFISQSLELAEDMSIKAGRSAKILSRLLFGQYVLLHLIEDTVRQALVYGILSRIVFWITIFIFIYELRNWRLEIVDAFRSRFTKTWEKLEPLLPGRFKSIVLPLLMVTVISHDVFQLVATQLIKFDFFKRLLSEVFKKKLEQEPSATQLMNSPGKDYLSVFDYYLPAKKEFYISREPLMAKKILNTIEGWLSGKCNDDLVILVGNRGIGKTTSAKVIFDSIKVSKIFLWVPPKVCEIEEFYHWLSDSLGSPIHSVEDFVKFESTREEKLVLVIDDIHNLFIGRTGGFKVYRLFMEIISLRTTKIFWCLTVNSHAWLYLQGVFGKEHFYGQSFTMRMWTDSEIQNLILARHNITGFKRSFDKSITAYGTGNVLGEQVETQFFRLLWGQSRGNPRSALMYWISAVSLTSERQIYVGVPKFINSGIVGTMSNEALIVLSTIARHDSLSQEELLEVTRIDMLIIRKCLKESYDKELLWTDENGRIRISSRAQNAIDWLFSFNRR